MRTASMAHIPRFALGVMSIVITQNPQSTVGLLIAADKGILQLRLSSIVLATGSSAEYFYLTGWNYLVKRYTGDTSGLGKGEILVCAPAGVQ